MGGILRRSHSSAEAITTTTTSLRTVSLEIPMRISISSPRSAARSRCLLPLMNYYPTFLQNSGGSLSDRNQLPEAKVMIYCPLLKEAKMITTGFLLLLEHLLGTTLIHLWLLQRSHLLLEPVLLPRHQGFRFHSLRPVTTPHVQLEAAP